MAVINQCKTNAHQQDGDSLLEEAKDRVGGINGRLLHFKPCSIRLTKASNFLQFVWTAHAIDGWVANSRRCLLLEDASRNLAATIALLQRHQKFEARLAAYNETVVQKFVTLKQILTEKGHQEVMKITQLHDRVIGQWQDLVAASKAKTLRLVKFAASCDDTVELQRSFAAQATEFDSWCTNAMESMLRSVPRGNPTKLARRQKEFSRILGSLHVAVERLSLLQALDAKLTSLKLPPNPFTRLTFCALWHTWMELLALANEYYDELEREKLRHTEASASLLRRVINAVSEHCSCSKK